MPDSRSISHLDLNLLKVFEGLYQQKNMTKVAAQLNITPSAVSHAVKRLRETLNDPLFVRQGAHMMPTLACQRMAPELLTTLDHLRRLLQAFGQFEPGTSTQTLTIAIHDALEPLFLPPILLHLQQKTPKASLESVKLDRERLSQQLASGEVDMAIDIARPLQPPIQHASLMSSPLAILVNALHPYLENQTEQAYIDGEHITVSNRPTGRVIEDVAFAQKGLKRQVKVRCQSYQTAARVIKQSQYFLTLPKSIGESLVNDDTRLIAMPITVAEVETHLYWHANTEDDGALRWYRNEIQKLFVY